MPAYVNWLAVRVAFLVGFALFVLAMFGLVPGIFLPIGFGIYGVAVAFWLYPKERLLPSDEDMFAVSLLLGVHTGGGALAKLGEVKVTPGSLPTVIVPSQALQSFHLPSPKA